MSNICCFLLPKSKDLMLFFNMYDSKVNIFWALGSWRNKNKHSEDSTFFSKSSGILWENDQLRKQLLYPLFVWFTLLSLPLISEHGDRPKEWNVLHHVEGRPCAVLYVCVLLQRPQPERDPGRREAHGGAERTLCVQVHPIPPWELPLNHKLRKLFFAVLHLPISSTLCPAACKYVARCFPRSLLLCFCCFG